MCLNIIHQDEHNGKTTNQPNANSVFGRQLKEVLYDLHSTGGNNPDYANMKELNLNHVTGVLV